MEGFCVQQLATQVYIYSGEFGFVPSCPIIIEVFVQFDAVTHPVGVRIIQCLFCFFNCEVTFTLHHFHFELFNLFIGCDTTQPIFICVTM